MIFRGSGGGPPQFAHTHGCKRTLKSWDNVAVSSTPPRYTTDGWKYNGKWVSSALAASETGTMLFDDTPLFHRFQNCSSARNRALRNGTTCGSGAPPQPCSKCCCCCCCCCLLLLAAACCCCCCCCCCLLLLLAAAQPTQAQHNSN